MSNSAKFAARTTSAKSAKKDTKTTATESAFTANILVRLAYQAAYANLAPIHSFTNQLTQTDNAFQSKSHIASNPPPIIKLDAHNAGPHTC